jgi:hypothetical protein
MKDVYSCWVGFVAMFSYGVAKKKKNSCHMVWS